MAGSMLRRWLWGVAVLVSIPLLMGQSCGVPNTPTTNPSDDDGDETPTTTCGQAGSNCLPTGAGPIAVAVADFNHDIAPDIAAVNYNDDSVSLWMNLGHGDFVTGGKLSPGDTPNGMVTADFNGDGHIDLAVSSVAATGPAAVVFLGKGDGTFQTPAAYAVSGAGAMIAVGDINGDGRLDLVLPIPQLGRVSILLNDGTGKFVGPADFSAGSQPVAAVVADLDRDGDLDIAVADRATDSVAVLRNNAVAGNFFPAITFQAGQQPSWIAAADVDADGDPDLVVTNHGADDGAADTVSVLPNNGNGTFTTARNFAAGVNPAYVGVADLNGDGLPDLAIADFGIYQGTADAQGAGVAVLLNAGGGSLATPILYPAGGGPAALAFGDFNRDFGPDMVVANFASNTLTLLPNYGAGVFSPPQTGQ